MNKIEKALQMCLSHPSFDSSDEGIKSAVGYFEFAEEWFKDDGAYSDYEYYCEGEDKEPTYWWITAYVDEIDNYRNVVIEAISDETGKSILISTRGYEVENRIDMELVRNCTDFDEVVDAVNEFLNNMDNFTFDEEPEKEEYDDWDVDIRDLIEYDD